MSGTIAQTGALASLNNIAGKSVPAVASSAPTWHPGLYWVNTADSNNVYDWDPSTTSWIKVPAAGSRYLALLITDPATSGSGGGPAVNVSDLIEDTTSGYSRQLISFSYAVSGTPNSLSNSGAITFGPYSADMPAAAQWAALVTSASGTSGLLLYTWDLDTPQQVDVSQEIIIPAGGLVLDE